MAKTSTSLISNVKLLYGSYGGLRAIFASEYFLISIFIAAVCWRMVVGEQWIGPTQAILPTLAGFSIAAYAMLFAVLSEKAREILRHASPELNGRSPLLVLASSISHAVLVQILGVLLSVIFSSKPFPTIIGFEFPARVFNILISALGMITMVYGIILVVASTLTVFRLLMIQSRI